MAIDNIGLLKHAIERFGVVTVSDAVLYNMDNEPVLRLDTLKLSNITSEGQKKEIKGGRFADLLAVYPYGRAITLDFQDALISMGSMKELWGATINDTNIIAHKVENITVPTAATKLTLSEQPAAGTKVTVVRAGVNPEVGVALAADFTLKEALFADIVAKGTEDATTPTPMTNPIAVGDTVQVFYEYVAATVGDFAPIEALLKSTSFAKTLKFVGTSFVIEQESGKEVEIEIEIPKMKVEAGFTLTMQAEGDASVFDFKAMALITNTVDRDLIKIKTIRYL